MVKTIMETFFSHESVDCRSGQIALESPIFEIAVYRRRPHELNAEYDASLTRHLQSLEPQYPKINIKSPIYQGLRFIQNQFWERYGQPYPYNQVIGWVVLFVRRDQLLAEYYAATTKRLTRNSRRYRFKGQGKCFAIYVTGNERNKQIIADLTEELRLLMTESPFKGRYIDTNAFMHLAPYINWRKLIRESH